MQNPGNPAFSGPPATDRHWHSDWPPYDAGLLAPVRQALQARRPFHRTALLAYSFSSRLPAALAVRGCRQDQVSAPDGRERSLQPEGHSPFWGLSILWAFEAPASASADAKSRQSRSKDPQQPIPPPSA